MTEALAPPARPAPAASPLVDKAWRVLTARWLSLALAASLALAWAVAALLPANETLASVERDSGRSTWVVSAYGAFELYDVLHSWWFALLLLAAFWHLLALLVERLPALLFLWRFPALRLSEVAERPPAVEAESRLNAGEIEERLRAAGFAVVRSAREDGGADLFAERGLWTRAGEALALLGALCLWGGAAAFHLQAYQGSAEVLQGGEVDALLVRRPDGVEERRRLPGFAVKCDDFRLREVKGGPRAAEADLRLLSNAQGSEGQVLAKALLTAKDPLRWEGLTLELAGFRQLEDGSRVRVQAFDRVAKVERQHLLGAGEIIEAAEGLSYQVVDYSADYAGQGPAVQLVRAEEPPGGPVKDPTQARKGPSPRARLQPFWVFQQRPDFDRDNRDDRFSFRLEGLALLHAVGLRASHDPGLWAVALGGALLAAGLLLSLAGSHRRVWVRLSQGKLALAGLAHRQPEAFAAQLADLRRSLGLPA